MALNRGSANRFSATIWPGFVDAMTALLLVLMFVLTIFMIVQSVLREQVDDQESTIAGQVERLSAQDAQLSEQEQRLGALGGQVADLAAALGAAQDEAEAGRQQAATLQADLDRSEAEARARAARIAAQASELQARQAELQARDSELTAARSRITDFEAEVAALMAAREQDRAGAVAAQDALRADLARAEGRASAAELAVAAARSEIDAQAELARLAAARRDALQAMIADMRRRQSEGEADQTALAAQLTEAEAARLTEAEAAAALRERLAGADSELTAMTLALEESRREAEETLTLLAAAQAAQDDATAAATAQATEAERQAGLLAAAQARLAEEEALSADGQRRVALLNEQVADLTGQLGRLQALLDAAGEGQEAAELRVADLGQQLNAALLTAAEEKDRRLAIEEQARLAAEDEAKDLARYRSEFFGRLSQILSGRQGVQVVGDRFVFDSNVLFQPGAAALSDAGREQVTGVADMLTGISGDIPSEIDWIIRVDGHTDDTPLSGSGRYRDNWELSQARALAVVRYLTDDLGFPAGRLAATGFADTRPVAANDSAENRARNRRIELKLTER